MKTIKDPEKPNTLEDLQVITEESVQVQPFEGDGFLVRIDFNPTVPHCSLASLIGLCLRGKIQKNVVDRIKLDIVIAEGKHSTEEESKSQLDIQTSCQYQFLFRFHSEQSDQRQGKSSCSLGESKFERNG